jgi:hypothetical protein
VYNNYYIHTNIKIIFENMLIVGLLSTKQEVEEIKYIAKICTLEDRIHFIVKTQKIKDMLKKERQSSK